MRHSTLTPIVRTNPWRISRERALESLALAAMLTLTVALHFVNLDAVGNGNHYYTAAIKAMLQSWHNFFFVAAEPGGSVTIDKPPVGLWLQVFSAYFFGVDSWGVILPQILAGILAMLIIYHLVRRWFGVGAGVLAGLAWTVTPVVLVVDRHNTMDSTLILTLLLAAWAFVKATEETRFRYLFLGVVLVGIGVNIKMLEAYLPLPAFYALYFLGAKEPLWRRTVKLALATVPLVVVSFSWAVIVDMTPASQRPYIGSSDNNSVINLMMGYNGAQRLLGGPDGNPGNLVAALFGANQGNTPRGGAPGPMPGGAFQPPQGFQPLQALGGNNRIQPPWFSAPSARRKWRRASQTRTRRTWRRSFQHRDSGLGATVHEFSE
jgi:4-amino-4-deoxy-L-arabinose transferase-like glycosyltransferase